MLLKNLCRHQVTFWGGKGWFTRHCFIVILLITTSVWKCRKHKTGGISFLCAIGLWLLIYTVTQVFKIKCPVVCVGAESRVWCLQWTDRCQCQIQGPCGTCIPQPHSRQVKHRFFFFCFVFLHFTALICSLNTLSERHFIFISRLITSHCCRWWGQSMGLNNEFFNSGSNSWTASEGEYGALCRPKSVNNVY